MVNPPKTWRRRLLTWGAELLLIMAILVGGERWMTRGVERDVPLNLSAMTTAGDHFDIQRFHGNSAIVYFWAEWCPVCHANRHVIASLAQKVPVMTIAMQSGSSGEVAAYMRKEGITFPVIADEAGEISQRLHINGVPTALIIDSQGRIRYVARGYTSEWGLRLRLWLAS